jgi:hypothetical protein
MLLLRTDLLPSGEQWLYELKLDGYRAIAFKRNGDVSLRSRNNNDFNERYPAVAKALGKLPDTGNTNHHRSGHALLSLLHIVRRRTGLPTTKFFDQHPPVEQDIVEHIGWREHERWFKVAEALVLTDSIQSDRTVVYNSERAPEAPGCSLVRFRTDTRTNWHYEAANALLDGTLCI